MIGMQIRTGSFRALLCVDDGCLAPMSFIKLPKVGDEVVFRHRGRASHVRVTGLRREMSGPSAGSFIVTAEAA